MTQQSSRSRNVLGVCLGLAAAAAIGLLPPEVEACGGFFCNQPQDPSELPVAQTAENVLFVMERAPSGSFNLEAHVQIFYAGPADRFSWVVPVDNRPELGVGANRIFQALLSTTQPRFGVSWRDEGICREPPPGTGGSIGTPGSPGSGGASTGGAGGSTVNGGGVDVSFRGDVGPYDAAVIRSTNPRDPKPLIDWLNENKYFISPEAARLIETYVLEEKYFVAIRLVSGKGVNEIQPLTMRFEGPGPCIPLRLTAIAAINNLRVNLWVLGRHRVVPENYFEIRLNESTIDWLGGGRNYPDLLGRAANEAGGNAFATEYAGPAAVMRGQLFRPGQFSLDRIRTAATPPDALDQIGAMGFARDTLMLEILRVHIPMPDVVRQMGVDERTFYNQLRSYWMQYQEQFKPWNATALASDLDAKLVQPLARAQEMFDLHPTLTRLATFISPDEMTVDPTFVMNPTLPEVPAQRTAQAVRVCGNREFTRCDAPVRVELPSGGSVWLKPTNPAPCQSSWQTQAAAYNRGMLGSLPALEVAWSRDAVGEGKLRFDLRAVISLGVNWHNQMVMQYAREYRPPPPPPSPGGVGDVARPHPHGGCGCVLPGAPAGRAATAHWGLALFGGLLLVLARRRRR